MQSLRIIGLSGAAIELEVSGECTIEELKPLIATQFGWSHERPMIVLAGDRQILDSELVSSVSGVDLQAVLLGIATAKLIGPELDGNSKFVASGVLAPNGCIYFAPCYAGQVLCVNPEAQTAEMIGPELDGELKFEASGVLAPNGCIYFAPHDAGQVLSVRT